ncbi:MAG: WYL domain-containing protein [Bacteroidetes bacterium]|nr:WYL domain-containing protein [Bacteroidota bacterium]
MADQARFDRLLRMMMMLSGDNRYSVDELAEKLELSRRSVYRNLNTFRDAGFIITGSDKYYKIDKQSPYLKSLNELLHFTREESWILNRAILALDDEIPIKQNLARKLYFLYDIKGVPYPVIKKEQSEKIVTLIRAIEDQQQVCFHQYQSPNSNTVRDRIVEPFEFTLNYSYVWCYDTLDGSNKLFKTARINHVEILPNAWENAPVHQAREVDLFRISGHKKIEVSLLLSMRASSLLTEEYPMAEDHLSPADKNLFRFRAEVSGFDGIGRFILGLMDEIVVESPSSLRKYLNEKISKKKF